MRDTKITSVSYSCQGVYHRNSLDDFVLAEAKNGQSPIFNQTKKINELANTIYKKLNPEFYKNHLGLLDRLVLWIYSYTSSSLFNKKLSGIISNYLDCNKNIDVPLLKKDNNVSSNQTLHSVDNQQFPSESSSSTPSKPTGSLRKPNSCPSFRSKSPWGNEFSLENFMFKRKLEEQGKKLENLTDSKKYELQFQVDDEIKKLKSPSRA